METRVLLYAPEGELIRAMDEENKERAVARPAHAIARTATSVMPVSTSAAGERPIPAAGTEHAVPLTGIACATKAGQVQTAA